MNSCPIFNEFAAFFSLFIPKSDYFRSDLVSSPRDRRVHRFLNRLFFSCQFQWNMQENYRFS